MMKNFLLIFPFLLFVGTISGQNLDKNLNAEPVIIQKYLGNGDVSNPNSTPPQQDREMRSQVRQFSKQLKQARQNGDIQLVKELEKQINALVGSKEVSPDFGPQAIQLVESIIPSDGPNRIDISTITPGAMWATATTTQNTDGRIWVATTHYAGGATDTLRIFYSDDDGLSWTYLTGFTYGGIVDFRTDDLDVEVLNDGSDWYIYITGSYDFSGAATGFVARFKTDGTGFFHVNLPKSTGSDQYWTRVVSDYPKWTSAAYVYIVATMDTAIDATTKQMFTRAFTIEDPYAPIPTVIDRNNNPNGNSYWWWYGAPAPNGASLKTDVAYFDSLASGDIIVTSSIFENTFVDSSIYMTYSDDYMATVPYVTNNFSLTYTSMRPIMSFSGGNDQLRGCIVTTRNWMNTANSDPWYIATNDGGATWMQGFIEASLDTTVKTDVIGLRGVDGHFKFAWINEDAPNPEFLYRTGYLNGSLVQTPIVEMYGAGIYPSSRFGGRAGYRLASSDSCFAVFEGPSGVTAYGVSGCTPPVTSVENEELPVSYSLSQNYPNPFNPSTSISFAIPQSGIVKLVVYDILGKEVATLLNEEKIAGAYEVNFNAKSLASGIYFYTIKAGNFSSTKKMILMK
ncbi:MAG: T9SS type A sorting domain-containing protein [Ignavibacteriaceae bacterium]